MVWLHMDVHLLIVVPLKGHLVVAKDSLWLAKVTLQEDVGDSKVKLVRRIIPVHNTFFCMSRDISFVAEGRLCCKLLVFDILQGLFQCFRNTHMRTGVSVL